MNSWKVILATMVIFGTGVVTGGLLVRHSERIRPLRPPHASTTVRPTPVPSAGGMRLEFLRRVQRELNLTPDQQKHVERLLKDSQERTRRLVEPVAPQLRQEIQRTKEDFREVLTESQRTRFDELLKQQQRPREPRHQQSTHERSPED
ncbi:MAG TPA: hypothetical protein VNZ22_00530, partial [Bacillota bacterium]|nr:hypothetical protein [Bacillota bacterium]